MAKKSIFRTLGWIVKFTISVICNAAGIYIFAKAAPNVEIYGLAPAVATILLIAIFNAILFPFFSRFALPLTVMSLGFGSLILNALIVLLASGILPNLEVKGVTGAFIFIIGTTVINIFISEILETDNEEKYFRNVIKRQARRSSPSHDNNLPGVIFLQIDGLSFNVLRNAIHSGNVPNISNMIRKRNYRLEKWETGWSSQTGASQAGILFGKNGNIPAFRWFDRKLHKVVSFSNRVDVKNLEQKISSGKGLLFHNGASRSNIFSGDAQDTLLTTSSIGRRGSNGIGHGYFAYFSNPYNLPRTIILSLVDIFREIKSIIEQTRRDVWPRLSRHEKTYPFVRLLTTVVLRDIIIQTIIGDIYEGKNTVYADLIGYDEVSHHTGTERHETLAVLRDIDRQIGRLQRAIENSNKPYQLVILSDHGQTQGSTFRQSAGYSLDQLVRKIIHKEKTVSAEMDNRENVNYINTAVWEITKTGGIIGKSFGIIGNIGKENIRKKQPDPTDIKILVSGALGLIYFTGANHRLTREEIDEKYPGLINGLVQHPLIGFILVRSFNKGGMVIGKSGKYFIRTGRVQGQNPLKHYGVNAAAKIRLTDGYPDVADIMVNSLYDPVMNETYAFEEQVGSHGALGGDQNYPFVLFPNNWYYPDQPVTCPEHLHVLLKKWLKNLGQPV